MVKMTLQDMDEKLLENVEKLRNRQLSEAMVEYTSLGSNPIALVLLGILYYFSTFQIFKTAAIALAVNTLIIYSLKFGLSRERPSDQLIPAFSSSFPSGHSANAFMFASVLGYFYTSLLPVLVLLAFLVAFSRIYLAEHYPTDVLAGTSIGILVGVAVAVTV